MKDQPSVPSPAAPVAPSAPVMPLMRARGKRPAAELAVKPGTSWGWIDIPQHLWARAPQLSSCDFSSDWACPSFFQMIVVDCCKTHTADDLFDSFAVPLFKTHGTWGLQRRWSRCSILSLKVFSSVSHGCPFLFFPSYPKIPRFFHPRSPTAGRPRAPGRRSHRSSVAAEAAALRCE